MVFLQEKYINIATITTITTKFYIVVVGIVANRWKVCIKNNLRLKKILYNLLYKMCVTFHCFTTLTTIKNIEVGGSNNTIAFSPLCNNKDGKQY